MGSDAIGDPKEHFYYEKAGFDGSGGSSYMMAQFRRDRDHSTAWYASSDGMEPTDYYARLWNGSLGAVVTDTGNMVEWGKFYSYGVSMSAPTCDADGDFDVDINDINIMGGTYVVIEDANLDGTLDTQDTIAALGVLGTTMGRGVLSYVGNKFGQAGYHHDLAVDEFRHVNARFMDSEIGRWGQRDRIGYVDGLSLYQYVRSNPIRFNDPMGLAGELGPGLPCGGGGGVRGASGCPDPGWCADNMSTLASCLDCCDTRVNQAGCIDACWDKFFPPPPPPPPPPWQEIIDFWIDEYWDVLLDCVDDANSMEQLRECCHSAYFSSAPWLEMAYREFFEGCHGDPVCQDRVRRDFERALEDLENFRDSCLGVHET